MWTGTCRKGVCKGGRREGAKAFACGHPTCNKHAEGECVKGGGREGAKACARGHLTYDNPVRSVLEIGGEL
jgi:hypothetical protein